MRGEGAIGFVPTQHAETFQKLNEQYVFNMQQKLAAKYNTKGIKSFLTMQYGEGECSQAHSEEAQPVVENANQTLVDMRDEKKNNQRLSDGRVKRDVTHAIKRDGDKDSLKRRKRRSVQKQEQGCKQDVKDNRHRARKKSVERREQGCRQHVKDKRPREGKKSVQRREQGCRQHVKDKRPREGKKSVQRHEQGCRQHVKDKRPRDRKKSVQRREQGCRQDVNDKRPREGKKSVQRHEQRCRQHVKDKRPREGKKSVQRREQGCRQHVKDNAARMQAPSAPIMTPPTSTPRLLNGYWKTLPNWGQTCFANSVIQYITPLVIWMQRSFPTGSWREQPITQLIQRMAVAPDLTTHTDTNTILRLAQYPISQPGCAHEFLTHILLQLTEGIPTSQPSTDTKGLPVPGTTERLSESDTRERLHPSIQMRTMTEINCHRCHYHSIRHTPSSFPTLRCILQASLSPTNVQLAPVRIKTCIRDELAIHKIPDTETYKCDCPEKTRHAISQSSREWLDCIPPDFLNIEVNRIAYGGERRVTSTAGQSINNNLLLVDLNHLDLSAYFSPIYTINREAIYTPISFLLHKGPTVNDGHWMAVIRDPHHGWRLHDDSRCLILDHWRDKDLTAVFKRVILPDDPPNSALQTVPTELLHLNIYETITAVLYQRVDLGAETPTGHSTQPLPSHFPVFLPTIPRHSHIPEAPQAYPQWMRGPPITLRAPDVPDVVMTLQASRKRKPTETGSPDRSTPAFWEKLCRGILREMEKTPIVQATVKFMTRSHLLAQAPDSNGILGYDFGGKSLRPVLVPSLTQEVWDLLRYKTWVPITGALITVYNNNPQEETVLGFHRDDERFMSHDEVINLSFGPTAELRIMPYGQQARAKLDGQALILNNGTFHTFNRFQLHKVSMPPNRPNDPTPRISISFRVFTTWAEIPPPPPPDRTGQHKPSTNTSSLESKEPGR
eukprot:g7187.t1